MDVDDTHTPDGGETAKPASAGNHSVDIAPGRNAVWSLHSSPKLGQGQNDAYCLTLSDTTIERTPDGSTCAVCGRWRLFNASECLHCYQAHRRRVWRAWTVVVLVVGLSFGAALLFEPAPEPRETHGYSGR